MPERGETALLFAIELGAARSTALAALLEVRAPYIAAFVEDVPAGTVALVWYACGKRGSDTEEDVRCRGGGTRCALLPPDTRRAS